MMEQETTNFIEPSVTKSSLHTCYVEQYLNKKFSFCMNQTKNPTDHRGPKIIAVFSILQDMHGLLLYL